MERYSKYKKHTVDTYAELLRKAFKAKGIYEAERHDTVIMSIAPLFVRLEQARESIKKHGVLVEQADTNKNIKLVRNPAIDVELAVVDRIRKSLKDMNLFVDKRNNADDDDDESDNTGDPMAELTAIMGGITRQSYKRPTA